MDLATARYGLSRRQGWSDGPGSQTRAQPLRSPALTRSLLPVGSLRASRGTVRLAPDGRLASLPTAALHYRDSLRRLSGSLPLRSGITKLPRLPTQTFGRAQKTEPARVSGFVLRCGMAFGSAGGDVTRPEGFRGCVTGPPALLPCRDITDIVCRCAYFIPGRPRDPPPCGPSRGGNKATHNIALCPVSPHPPCHPAAEDGW